MPFCISFAAVSLLDFLEIADSEQGNFWYTSNDRLTIRNVSNSLIDVDSPVIKDGTGDIASYLFVASTERAYWNPVNYRCFYNVSINWNKFSVELDTSELTSSQVYYLYAIPVSWSDPLDGLSNWICSAEDATVFLNMWKPWKESSVNWEDPCFKISDKVYWEWLYCERWNNNNSNNQSDQTSVRTITSNATHLCDKKKITVGRNSFADVNLEILLRYDNENTFKKMADVNSNQLSYTFNQVFDGDHIVKIKPSDWTTPVDYTIHCLDTSSPEVKPVDPVKPPVVWPKENIMIIIIWTVVLYLVYRIATRKRS